VTLRYQVKPELLVIVDFAVEYHPNGLIFVGDWLVAAAEIDDAEPAHANGAAILNVEALIVRPAVLDLIAHGANGRQIS
jgi:hypothetical protein